MTFFVLSRYFTGIREKNQSFLVISSRVETNPRQVSQVFQRALAVFTDLQTLEGLDQFEHDFLGKQGEVTLLRKGLKNLSPEEKQQAGPEIQKAFEDLSAKVAEFRSQHEAKACVAQMEQEWIDVTKSLPFSRGALHPLSQIQRRVEQIFTSMGFDIADGPEVETEWYNFDALNIPGDHPARDMQDTFWISHDSNDSQKNLQ